MYGGFDGWMTTALGGLDTVSNATTTGWRVLTVRPLPAAMTMLGHAAASVDTRLGKAAVAWRVDVNAGSAGAGARLSLNVTVPVGAVAELHVPHEMTSPGGSSAVSHLASVAEVRSGATLVASRIAARRDANASVFIIGSGVHDVLAHYAV